MKSYSPSITAFITFAISMFVASSGSIAQNTPFNSTIASANTSSAKKTVNRGAKRTGFKKTKIKAELSITLASNDDNAVDLNDSTTQTYQCELNDSLTIYTNTHDDNRAALRWKNKIYGLKRIATTTGANRFENKKVGLVWIRIPTKGMLLDSLHGEQLANECKTTSY